MPPLHPALVHFPIALLAFSFVLDLLGRFFSKESLRAGGFWCAIGALVGGAAAAAAGYFDYSRGAFGETLRYVHFHMYVGWALVACVIGVAVWRWRVFSRSGSPSAAYLIVALFVVGLALFQGWYGGEMVYSQGAGVAAAGKGTEPADNGRQKLDAVTPGR